MKRILLILILGIFLISFISAECQQNNDFEIGDDFNICTKRCKYYNSTGDYQNCDSSIICYLIMDFPNGSMLGFFNQMQFNASGDEIFNYSYGNLTNTTKFPAGIYNGQINCYSLYGFSESINFEASVSSEEETFVSRISNPATIIEETKDFVIADLLEHKWKFVIGLGAFLLVIIIFYDYKKYNWKKLGDYLANKIKTGRRK